MKIVLAIPSYNRAHHLETLLPEVVKQGFYKIYVLDDGSTDATAKVCAKFPAVTFIHDDKNLGPTGNRNRILGQDMGDVIFFLDDDVRLETAKVPAIVDDIFRTHPKTAVVSGTILTNKRKPAMFCFEREANPLFRWVERLFGSRNLPLEAFDVPYISVAWVLENAFAIRTEVFKNLGGFDEVYRKFQEGPDLCKRAIMAGHEVAITNRYTALHTEPYSAFHSTQFFRYVRSSLIWYYKYAFGRNRAKPN